MPLLTSPVVQSRAGASQNTNTTSHTITMPSGVIAGDLILVVFGCRYGSSLAGFTMLASGNTWNKTMEFSTNIGGAIFWKIATGSDSLTVTTSTSTQSAHQSYRISGGRYVSAREGFDSDFGYRLYPHDLTANYVFVVSGISDSATSATSTPTGYGNLVNRQTPNPGDGVSLWAADRQLKATEEDGHQPGLVSMSNGFTGRTFTIAVSPYDPFAPENKHPYIIDSQQTGIIGPVNTHTINIPNTVRRGELILVNSSFTASTTVSVSTGSGWQVASSSTHGTISNYIIWKISDGNDTLALNTVTACGSSAFTLRIVNASSVSATSNTNEPNVAINFPPSDIVMPFMDSRLWVRWAATERSYFLYTSDINGVSNGSFGHNVSIFMDSYIFPFASIGTTTLGNPGNFRSLSGRIVVEPKYEIIPYDNGFIRFDSTAGSTETTFNLSGKITESSSIQSPNNDLRYEDMVVLIYSVATTGSRNPTLSIPGYTTISEQYSPGGTYNTKMLVAYKFMGPIVDTSVTVSGTGNASDPGGVQGFVFRGVDPFDIFDNNSIANAIGSGTTRPTSPTVAFSTIGSLTVRASAGAASSPTNFRIPSPNTFYLTALFSGGSYSSLNTMSIHRPNNQEVTTSWTGGDASADNSWAVTEFRLKPSGIPYNGGVRKVWNGSEWVVENKWKIWDGTNWVPKPYAVWNGTLWLTKT